MTPDSGGEHAIVVGAGVAGLAAAYRLERRGFTVTVLEAENYIGGRTSTLEKDGFRVDLAATMLLGSYRKTIALIDELGVGERYGPASDLMGVARDGVVHRLSASRPIDAARTKLLSAKAKLRLSILVADVRRHVRKLDWEDPALAAALDYGSAKDYADRRLRSAELRDQLLDPACRFLCLSSLQDVPAVDFLFLARNMGKTTFFNNPAGMDFLARTLADTVRVETGAVVTEVEERPGEVVVHWRRDGEPAHVDSAAVCVMAVPAPRLLDVYPQLDAARRDILGSVVYAPSLNIHIGLARPPREKSALILIPENSDRDLACIILDHNKASGRVPPGGGLISTYWQRDWSESQWDRSDEDVLTAALSHVDRILPGVDHEPRMVHVQRWKHALVSGPHRRHRDLMRLRALTSANSRIRLAGDSVSASNIESCVSSGERAAAEAVASVRGCAVSMAVR